MFDNFMQQWIGKRISDPLLLNTGMPLEQTYQCVSLIKQYILEDFGIPNGYYGNAIDWWTNTSSAILEKFTKVETQDVAKGDIVILKTVGHTDYAEPGHIVLATGNENSSQFEALEQDGATGGGTGLNGDAIRTRWITKSRIAGVLRPTIIASPTLPYTLEPTDFTAWTTHDSSLWHLEYTDWAAMNANAIGQVPAYTPVQIVAKTVGHPLGEFWLYDASADAGYLSTDMALSAPTPAPVPYKPPGAPAQVKLASKQALLTTVPTYPSALDADNRNLDKSNGSWPAGDDYYLFATDGNGMLNIGLTNQAIVTVWVNPLDNVAPIVPPVPEQVIEPQVVAPSEIAPQLDPASAAPSNDAWKATYVPFHPGNSPITKADDYIVNIAGYVTDLAGLAVLNGAPIEVPLVKGEHVNAYGKFMYDHEWYYRLRIKRDVDFKYFLGVPVSYNGRAVLILPPSTWLEKLFHRGIELKSIFEDSEPKWLDSIINPYKRKKK